ncbi:MAG TPA: hypothetical protein VGK17_02975 [Propionicimonas sp.]|jgi:hypothetical protein
MYRIARHLEDDTVTFTEYQTRHRSEANGLLALRFDSELMALKQQGITLGVKRWTEVVFKMDRFGAEVLEKLNQMDRDLAEIAPPPEDATDEQVEVYTKACEEITISYGEWQSGHPSLFLSQTVGVWLAINMAGERATLADVLAISDEDIDEDMDDLPEYIPNGDIPDDIEDLAGKA